MGRSSENLEEFCELAIDERAAPDSDRKFVSIFDIVDRKVWLAVGGVFRDATALCLQRWSPVFVSVAYACGRQCGKVLSDRSESERCRDLSLRVTFQKLRIKRDKGIWWMPWH